MTGTFDPYHKWLGIPRDQRPPTYYQLLGIGPEEEDRDVIEEAAIRQTAHLRTYQSGPHGKECARILGEVAKARLVLLDPEKRRVYDAKLSGSTIKKSGDATGTQLTAVVPTAVAAPAAADFTELGDLAPAPATDSRNQFATPARNRSLPRWALVGAGFGCVAIVVAGFALLGGRGKKPADSAPQARANSTSGLPGTPVVRPTRPDPLPVEGERLRVLSKSSNFGLGTQGTRNFSMGTWSLDAHLFAQTNKQGEWADLEVPLPSPGKYRVIVCLTKAGDYGILQLSLDGKALGEPIDCYDRGIVNTGPLDLGTVELSKKLATLRVTVVGANEKSRGPRHQWGLDYVRFRPTDQ